ncbi:serine hydrolase domain-containing protein [Maribacter chungangensis]|uniref:Beta-lactamase n=1 Tax=Maribacter chungangensis TaxID=1069117 RepID=A0ABW3B384_9FLAO
MKNSLLSIIFLCLFACDTNRIPYAKDMLDRETNTLKPDQLNLIFDNSKVFPDNTQLAIGIIANGKTSFYGIKRENGALITVKNAKKVFEIGSISKVFTATLLANFIVKSKVFLNEPINTYWDNPFKADKKLTFKNLANHTSGLPRLPSNLDLLSVDQDNPYKDYDAKKLDFYLTEEMEMADETEHPYLYSNLGVGLLGFTLSKIENSSYEALLQTYITEKFNMPQTTTLRNIVASNMVQGQGPNGKSVPNWDLNVLVGAGGILSSVTDLSTFALAQFDASQVTLALTRKKTANVDERTAVGLGWHIVKNDKGHHWVSHSGGTGGYSSSMLLDITDKNAVIILSNVSGFNDSAGNIEALAFALMHTLEAE